MVGEDRLSTLSTCASSERPREAGIELIDPGGPVERKDRFGGLRTPQHTELGSEGKKLSTSRLSESRSGMAGAVARAVAADSTAASARVLSGKKKKFKKDLTVRRNKILGGICKITVSHVSNLTSVVTE